MKYTITHYRPEYDRRVWNGVERKNLRVAENTVEFIAVSEVTGKPQGFSINGTWEIQEEEK